MKKIYKTLLATLVVFVVSCYAPLSAQVMYRDTVISWKHFEYTLDEFNGMESYSTSNIVDDQYPGIVIENEYIRLVVLPEFGARVISFYYKPTGHEQFYLNPVGTPYGMGDGNFYYDWLMVMGGVFPTFPEPEHGKTWFLPWEWELTETSEDKVSLSMQLQDNIDYPSHPGKFNNGVSMINCITTISLEKGKSSFDLQHTLINTRPQTVVFEYWTCATFAPGSSPEDTYTPVNSEIIAPIDYVYLKDDWWSWMGNAEDPAVGMGNHVFEYENLAIFENWEDMGIAYAHPGIDKPYYGVINHENEEGVFRVSDNAGITPGMKFWTWGAQQGLNANPQNFYETARPYIELWSGISKQFFQDSFLTPNEEVTWTETYLPTVGMEAISGMNRNASLLLDHVNNEEEQFLIKAFTTTPDNSYYITASLEGISAIELLDEVFESDALAPESHTIYISDYNIPEGDYMLNAIISDQDGNTVLESSLPVTIPLPIEGIPSADLPNIKVYRTSGQVCRIEFEDFDTKILHVFSIDGRLVSEAIRGNKEALIRVDTPGIYIIRIQEKDRNYSLKLLF